jgi:hypothetical protein
VFNSRHVVPPGPRHGTLWIARLVITGLAAAFPSAVQATLLQATVSGGLISGEFGPTAFTNAPYTVTAVYDLAVVQSGSLAGFPATFVSVSPTITIDTGSGILAGTLAPFAGFTWHLFSLAVTENASRSGFAPIDGGLNVTNAFDIDADLPQSSLLAQLAFGGESVANDPATWPTSVGTLNITASTDGAGTFAIVPEPAGSVVVGIALVALAGWRWFGRP